MPKQVTQEQMKSQSAEFSAVNKLCNAYSNLPAVVDDYYPEARHYYESAMQGLIKALRANGRIP